jgi:hypothetical protein
MFKTIQKRYSRVCVVFYEAHKHFGHFVQEKPVGGQQGGLAWTLLWD